jgi:DNA-binding GntR family transcriptional regulator
MIITLRLAPGQAVSELELSESLGIGRTPIREALQRLAREGLVTIVPRRGIFVSEINVKRQLRLLEVRRALETLVARTAARRATDAERERLNELADIFERCARSRDDVAFMRADREFNSLSSSACHNEFASGAMGLIHSLSRRFYFTHHKQAGDVSLTARMHAEMARAIAGGSEARAAKATGKLLDVIEKFTRDTTDL